MYVVYEQRWKGGANVSIHRSPMDIGEFAMQHNPPLERDGFHKEVKSTPAARKSLEGTLGRWK